MLDLGEPDSRATYPLKGLKVNSTLETLVLFVEYKEVEEDDNNEEFLEVIYLKNKLPKRITSKKTKIILDIDEHSKYPEVPTKLFQLMTGKEQMVLRDERRTGLKVVSLSDGCLIASIPEMHFTSIMHILLMKDN